MTFDFHAARLTMVESQVRTSDVTDYLVQDAMRIAPREALCPPAKMAIAYADADIEYAPGLYLLRPRAIGKLLQAIKPLAHEKALAIAAPYGAQVLRIGGLQVDEISADKTPARGAYQVIVVEGSVSEVPASWTAALAEGGRMAVIVRDGPMGKAHLYAKTGGRVVSCEVFDAAAAFLPGHEPKAQFAF
jgi:protein-L-isoaspartate(D-aspartate) O-methyltransferase